MPIFDDQRPDPDALLAQVTEQERRATRGKLRIYFGASAGVGKTYAMLNAGRTAQSEGRDVLVGIVETHGRNDTTALLDGLEVLPRKDIVYRDKHLTELDIDAALTRKPDLILVDELAHSNAAGSRHAKRWQDVDELLGLGIDVYTTVNVQHLESLNDVVGSITGIRVAETLPDTVFDGADEIVLIDIPVDELLARLKTGRVYQAKQAEQAAHHFFRKGNLIALRELALRRTADRIEGDVQAYRVERSIDTVWKTDTALLACVGPDIRAEHVIRSTARLATQLNAQWHAVYVETPRLQRLPGVQRERILKTLKLAQDLGATTAVLAGSDVAREIVHYAYQHNFSRIVLGRQQSRWFSRQRLRQSIVAYAPEVDILETAYPNASKASSVLSTASQVNPTPTSQPRSIEEKKHPAAYAWTALACAITTVIATPMLGYFDLANIVMLFLLTELLVAIQFGRGPAALAAFLSVAAFDFFFVPPRFTFAVSDVQYLVVFMVMLIVGLVAGQLMAGLRYQSQAASSRERRARALYEFSRALSSTLQTEQILEITCDFVQRMFHTRVAMLLPDEAGRLQLPDAHAPYKAEAQRVQGENTIDELHLSEADLGIAQWAFDRGVPAGMGTDTLAGNPYFYLPLAAPMRVRGVLVMQPEHRSRLLIPEQRQQLDTFAALAGIALERMHYIEVAQAALLRMESERLRSTLLATLSQD